jgi:hypothetical protein
LEEVITYVLFLHWLHDFVGQNVLFPNLKVGENKSKSWAILCLHVFLYTAGMILCLAPFLTFEQLAAFAAINGGSHFVIDAITSRLSSWAYARQDFRTFWITIGFDQFLHVAILCATL